MAKLLNLKTSSVYYHKKGLYVEKLQGGVAMRGGVRALALCDAHSVIPRRELFILLFTSECEARIALRVYESWSKCGSSPLTLSLSGTSSTKPPLRDRPSDESMKGQLFYEVFFIELTRE